MTETAAHTQTVTTADLYADGFTGRENSALRRRELLRFFDLPARLSTSSFLKVVNGCLGADRYHEAVEALRAMDN